MSALNGSGNQRLRASRPTAAAPLARMVAHALAAVGLNLMTMQELAADPQVVTAARVVRVGEVVTHVPHPLVLMARIVLVAAQSRSP